MSAQVAFTESGSSLGPQPTLTVKQRAKLIRAATPNILESLYEMSNRICDLCSQPIQDLILAALDHSTPVICFARGPLPIEEAIAQANDPKNLRCAHATCNHVKLNKTREEWFTLGLDKAIGTPHTYTDGELLAFQFRLGAGDRTNRVNGTGLYAPGFHTKGGRKAFENGAGLFAMTPEAKTAAGHKAARTHQINGTGFYGMTWEQHSAIGRKGGHRGGLISGRIAGFTHRANGTGIFGMTAEAKREASRKGVATNRKNGTGVFGMTTEEKSAGARISGRINGRKHKENGTGIFAPGMHNKAGHRAHELHPEMAAENGRHAAVTNMKNRTSIFAPGYDKSKGGRVSGRMNANRRVGICSLSFEQRSANSRLTCHRRYHIARGLVNPNCGLCQEASNENSNHA